MSPPDIGRVPVDRAAGGEVIVRDAAGVARVEDLVLDLSVVTYNSARWLDGLLDSLLASAWPAVRINLVIRDNGSSDDTVARLEKRLGEVGDRFFDVHLSRGDNIGFGRGHNENMTHCHGPFLLLVNPDVVLAPDAVLSAMRFACVDNPEVAAWEFRQQPYEHPKIYDPVTLETSWVSAACVLLRRAAADRVGGFEPGLFLYGEDVELSWRLRSAGCRLRYVPWATCFHFTYAHPGEVKPRQLAGSITSNLLLRARYGRLKNNIAPWILLPLYLLRGHGVPRRRRIMLGAYLKAAVKLPYFLRSRVGGDHRFVFHGYDYEVHRPGAFHQAPAMTREPGLVSLIVRTRGDRNGALYEALISIANQTYRNIEVVVVEDGGDAAAPMVEAVRRTSSRIIRHVSLAVPVGRARAGNAGLEACTGDFIGFLDDDDLLYADHVETLAAHLADQSRYGAAYGLSFEVPTHFESVDPWRVRAAGYRHDDGIEFSVHRLRYMNFLPIQSVLFRRALYERHGGFDTGLDLLEDWNLWVRYSSQSPFMGVPKVTSLYRTPAGRAERRRRHQALRDAYAHVAERNARACGYALAAAEAVSMPRRWARWVSMNVPVLGPAVDGLARLKRAVCRKLGR